MRKFVETMSPVDFSNLSFFFLFNHVLGESPSSSASDVDNLYNQVTMDKTALLRGMTSNAANHVTIVQNRPSMIRLLQFVS